MYKHLSEKWFDYVSNGEKVYECRLDFDFWGKIKIGDIVTFYTLKDDEKLFCEVEIIDVMRFKTFAEAIKEVGLKNVLPSEIEHDIDTAVDNVYYKIYTKEKEEKFGIVMLKLMKK